MEQAITHMEAWNNFFNWMLSRQSAGEIAAMPKDIQEAKYAASGERRYGLGEKRIKNLLPKYAPDRYRFEERVILVEP